MVTGVLEAVGTAVGVAGLLAAFKGAVDGYLLIDTIFDKDNNLKDLVLDYSIEEEKLTSWGDRYKIHGREEDCLFYLERPSIKKLMAEVFARIQQLHTDAHTLLDDHQAHDLRVLQPNSSEVRNLSAAQRAKKNKKRVKLAIKNKAKFEEIIRKLRKANDDLQGLLTKPELQAFWDALPAYVLANHASFQYVQHSRGPDNSMNELIRQTAQLKLVQISSTQRPDATLIDLGGFHKTSLMSESRVLGIYQSVARVWIEWLNIEGAHSTTETINIRDRIRTLSVMLQTAPQSFRVARCIGYTYDAGIDQGSAHRVGLVFKVPDNITTTIPVSLLDLIKKYRQVGPPPLGDRFILAQTLATTIMQLHASDWLHKALRGDNILFFPGSDGTVIANPYLAGFEYARDANMQSIGARPNGLNELDYYHHPDVADGFTKSLDWYSFGVILLEIAYWRPLRSKIPKQIGSSLGSIRELFVESADASLDAEVGSIYAGVVRKCLSCTLPDPNQEAEFACAMNTDIVLQLHRCVA